MAEGKSKPSGGGGNPTTDLLWFLGIIVCLFFLWVAMGGPEKARQKKLGPIIGPGQSQGTGTQTTPNSPQGSQNTNTNSSNSGGVQSGEIKVTPL